MNGRASKPNPHRGLTPNEAAGLIFLAFVAVVTAIVVIGSIAVFGLKLTALALGCFAGGLLCEAYFDD